MISINRSRYWSKDYLLKNPLGRSILYSGLILAFLLVMFFLILLPKTKAIVTRWHKIAQMKTESARLERNAGLFSGWDWQEVEKTAKLVEFAFPAKKDIYLIIFAVQDPIRRHGFVIEKMSFDMGEVVGEAADRSNSTNKPNSIVVNLSVLGREKQLGSLIDDFNKSLPLMSVSDISFSSQGNSSLVKVQMKLKIYFYPFLEKKIDFKKSSLKNLQLTKGEIKTVSLLQDYYDRGSNFYQRLKLYQGSSFHPTTPEKERENPFLLP